MLVRLVSFCSMVEMMMLRDDRSYSGAKVLFICIFDTHLQWYLLYSRKDVDYCLFAPECLLTTSQYT